MSAKVLKSWAEHLRHLRGVLGGLPDGRTGDNIKYSMQDIGLGAFSVFFTQCPSFLARQKTMQQAQGLSNAQSLFHLEQIPCDNHLRQTLDPVPPEKLVPCYDAALESLQAGHLESWRALRGTLLIPLDGWRARMTRNCGRATCCISRPTLGEFGWRCLRVSRAFSSIDPGCKAVPRAGPSSFAMRAAVAFRRLEPEWSAPSPPEFAGRSIFAVLRRSRWTIAQCRRHRLTGGCLRVNY
jgi:hypothetical protein